MMWLFQQLWILWKQHGLEYTTHRIEWNYTQVAKKLKNDTSLNVWQLSSDYETCIHMPAGDPDVITIIFFIDKV